MTYVEWDGAAFTVIDSPEADSLFERTATCTNDIGGYTVSYPASWHTNEGGEAPACSWFGPAPSASGRAALVAFSRPEHVPIGLNVVRTGLGQIPEWPRILSEEIVIGGVDGFRTEDMVPGERPQFMYGYGAWLEPDPFGLKFLAGAISEADGEYILNKAVLDRIMGLIEFDEAP